MALRIVSRKVLSSPRPTAKNVGVIEAEARSFKRSGKELKTSESTTAIPTSLLFNRDLKTLTVSSSPSGL